MSRRDSDDLPSGELRAPIGGAKTVPNVGTENEAPTVGALDPSCRGKSSL